MIPEAAITGNRVSRRKLRSSLGSRTGRKSSTKGNYGKSRPRTALAKLINEAKIAGYEIGA